ncbi:MAG: HDIG domain-containing protein [Planctomycetales bacterium]|nr:HDIG domain-containing protein [Planctomycetales bacterium]
MASPNTKRTRSERVASLQLEPTILKRWLRQVLTGKTLLQVVMSFVAGILIIVILKGWQPAFPYREGQVPDRDVVARVSFEMVDAGQTEQIRKQRRRNVLCFYENRPLLITSLASTIKNKLASLLDATPYEHLTAEQHQNLQDLRPDEDSNAAQSPEEALASIRKLFDEKSKIEGGRFDQALKAVLDPLSETGVLKSLGHDSEQGSQRSIRVFPIGLPDDDVVVEIAKVRHSEIVAELPQLVAEKFQQAFPNPDAVVVAKMVSGFLTRNLPVTLSYQKDMSERARRTAEESVEEQLVSYIPTVSKLAEAGKPITRGNDLPRLRAEYEAWIANLTWGESLFRLVAFAGMVSAMYLLCGLYIYYQYDRTLITEPSQLMRLLGIVLTTCWLCSYAAPDPFRAEVIPLILSAVTMTITFGRQVALLITTCLCLTITLGLGLDIGEFVTLCSGTCAAALLLGRIRTRTKLIYVGLAAGTIVTLTHLGVDTVLGKLNTAAAIAGGTDLSWFTLLPGLFNESLRLGGFTLLATTLMYGLLPFIERLFGVQTDLSLLELGDASHPLLRQLAQRAPGTYNHSINVAAIAEAAADSIGAHGLLTRVGAYFHDIGKMFKPNYFVENQERGGNCHDTLQPAMSTLVIIAHVKDGADLGRQHRLPKPIIDFIEQHHGTTLVEYFYREATKRSQADPNKEEVSETSFRYPGPRPQTLEAAVLMLADSVESASRTLVEPTSSRIQNLVDQIAMKKLLDGQFDQCGLTLQQLDQLKNSLVKSLTAIYHGRVKYSGQAAE